MGAVVFIAGLQGTRWAVRRARTRVATTDGTWQQGVEQHSAEDGRRFEGNVYYFASSAVIGAFVAVAAAFSYVPVWIGLLGLLMLVVGTASAESLIRHGNANLEALSRTMRGWLRL